MSDDPVQRPGPPVGAASVLTTRELVNELRFRMGEYAGYSTAGPRTRAVSASVEGVLAGVADGGLEDEILMRNRRIGTPESVEAHQEHWRDADGRPAGGYAYAPGLAVRWQQGPLVDAEGRAVPRNGAFVEDLIEVGIGRVRHYQATEFACVENAVALGNLLAAAEVLAQRQRARRQQGVAGSHQLHES